MSSNLVGAVIIFRHGDRLGYYQDPKTYSASDTTITPLGSLQEYQSGLGLQQRYLNATSGSPNLIQNISWPKPDLTQIDAIADSAEGQVILDSAYALTQGMFPANLEASTITLANGTNVTTPLGGYVYIPVESIEPSESVSLEGFTDCPAFTARTTNIYNSTAFQAVATENAAFLTSLKSVVGNRSTAFSNMYNVFDYMNVNYIHNTTFYNTTTIQQMEQTRALANYHEQGVFTDPSPTGVGNIAGRTILAPILEALYDIGNSSSSLKLQFIGIAYKPFFSLFNMTEVGINGMVDYASVLSFEVTNSSGTLEVSFNFRNGSATNLEGTDLVTYPMFGSSSNTMALSDFITKLEPYTVPDLASWCTACNNTQTRGCDVIAAANASSSSSVSSGSNEGYSSATSTTGKHHVSPVVAGVIGAVLGLFLAALFMVGAELWRKKKGKSSRYTSTGDGSSSTGRARGDSHTGDSDYELTAAPDRKA